MPTGTVKFFSKEKGYGFIRQAGVVEDIFFHHTSIRMEGFRTVDAGQTVQFLIKKGPKGTMAVDVLPIVTGDGLPKCPACGQELPAVELPAIEVDGT